ncbi:hypothetical protein VTH82DRAFT_3400 [Thermothelomyces myriococcoides]
MVLSTKISFAVLLAAAAERVAAAPQRISNGTVQQPPSNGDGDDSGIVRVQTVANPVPTPSAIPPEVLASQQSSAAAVASSIAAANEAAAASGLKELPGLQADESPASLLPLPALATGDAITPPAGEDSSTTIASAPTQVASQSDVAETQSLEGNLRQLPGLDEGTASPSSLAPLPAPPNVDTLVETATSGAVQTIGSFTEDVGTTATEVVSSAMEATTSAAGPVVGSFTPITEGTTATAVIGSFSPIAASPSASESEAIEPSAVVTPSQGLVFNNGTSPESGVTQATSATLLPLPSGAADGSLQTLPSLNNNTAGSGMGTDVGSNSGIDSGSDTSIDTGNDSDSDSDTESDGDTGSDGDSGTGSGTDTSSESGTGTGTGISDGSVSEDGSNTAPSPSLQPLPNQDGTGEEDTTSDDDSSGVDGGSSSLRPLPNDPTTASTSASATAIETGTGTGTGTGTATAGPITGVEMSNTSLSALPSALTTLTTILSDGATSTLVTAAAAVQTGPPAVTPVEDDDIDNDGAGVANATARSGAEGRVEVMARSGMWMGVVVGAVGMMAALMA